MTPLNNIFTWLNKYIYRILTILNRIYTPPSPKRMHFQKNVFSQKIDLKRRKMVLWFI